MTQDEYLNLPDTKKALPVLLLVGDEGYFKEEVIAALRKALEGPQEVEIRVGRAPLQAQRVFDELRTNSFFSKKKIVIAREADHLLIDRFEEILKQVGTKGGPVLILDVGGIDRRTKAGKALEKAIPLVECKKLYESPPPWSPQGKPWEAPLALWTAKEAKKAGLTMDPRTAFYLTRFTGNNLYEIRSTIEKLSLAGLERVEATHVETLSGKSRRDDVLAVTEAVGKREWAKAMVSLSRIFEKGLEGKEGRVGDPATIGVITLGREHRL